MAFNPHTDRDRTEMLRAIGVDRVDQLFQSIPEDIRFPGLDLPPALTEMEASQRLQELADLNVVPSNGTSFLGAGSYRHFVPATVNNLLQRGEFFTAYTPYQPEVAQGTLQTIYEFQSMVAALYDMDVANASIYDGATATAEAVLMAVAASKGRHKVVVSGTLHPAYRGVVQTYADGAGVALNQLPVPVHGLALTANEVIEALGDDVAAVVVQYPSFFGGIEDLQAISDAVHDAGALLIVASYPVPLALLKPPGAFGADIATGEGQSLGIAQSFGGPYLGLLSARQSFVRLMPGRLAGMTTDSTGQRGYVLTLQTREQHIRREKATSNICTNQGLMATAATIYMATMGPEGFREVARRSYQNAHYLARELAALPGYSLASDLPFFNEFTLRLPVSAPELNVALEADGLIGGYDLAEVDAELDRHMLLATTEMNSRDTIDRFVKIARSLAS